MFNLFPKFGSPGDMAAPEEILGKTAVGWTHTQAPGYLQAQQEVIDELMKEVNSLRHLKEENVKLIEYIRNLREQQTFLYQENEKLKKDIVDYVIEKDDEINELKKTQDWNKLNQVKTEKYCVCNHCGFKLYYDAGYWGSCSFCKEGTMIEKEEAVQTQPTYPIHWGGWDKEEKTTAKNLESRFNNEKDILDYFNSTKIETTTIGNQKEMYKWECPCCICKKKRGQ